MRAFFLRRLLVLHKKWFCECEVERPSSNRPGRGVRGLRFSATQPRRCTDIGSWKQRLFFGKSVSLGFLFCFARHPQQNTLGLVGSGAVSGSLWRVHILFWSSTLGIRQGHGSVGSCFYLAVSLNFFQKRRLFWFCGRMAFGEKDNQRKMERLGILFTDSVKWVKNLQLKVPYFLTDIT